MFNNETLNKQSIFQMLKMKLTLVSTLSLAAVIFFCGQSTFGSETGIPPTAPNQGDPIDPIFAAYNLLRNKKVIEQFISIQPVCAPAIVYQVFSANVNIISIVSFLK